MNAIEYYKRMTRITWIITAIVVGITLVAAVILFSPRSEENVSLTSLGPSTALTVEFEEDVTVEITSIGSNFTLFFNNGLNKTVETGQFIGGQVDVEDQEYASSVELNAGEYELAVQNAAVNLYFSHPVKTQKVVSDGNVYIGAFFLLGLLDFMVVTGIRSRFTIAHFE